ncbi:MAG TPA: hypothetical protein VK364_06040, partial [Hymenobacter sp.]|nr:hypothetical protein [Hymenobacter sp.]
MKNLLPFVAAPDDLAQALLGAFPTGLLVLRPLPATSPATIADFVVLHLNAAGQRLLQCPAPPEEALLSTLPHAAALLACSQHVWQAGSLPDDAQLPRLTSAGVPFKLSASRSGDLLVLALTEADQSSSHALDQALRVSQAGELAARAAADHHRARLERLVQQAPA